MTTGEHRLGSLLAVGAKRGEKGSLTFNQDRTILAAPGRPGSDIAKEHDRAPGQDAQIVRPSTLVMRLRCGSFPPRPGQPNVGLANPAGAGGTSRPSRRSLKRPRHRTALTLATGCPQASSREVRCYENHAPLRRHHHRCKQAEGRQLEQPEPGVVVWRTPSGRTYATTATGVAAHRAQRIARLVYH